MNHRSPVLLLLLALAPSSLGALSGCRTRSAEPESRRAQPLATATTPAGDPMQGRFTLAQATAGLTGEGPLTATLTTSLGTLECELYETKAPLAVANFVGLARGLRPFKGPGGEWVTRPGYDGTVFHRVVKGFMIQGGDWRKNGTGDGGYVFADEVWGGRHDRRGQLCMANKGPNTNSMQFFITDGPAPHLDRGYTIFGQCGPDAVVEALASVPTRGDRSLNPTVIEKVTIARKASAAPAPSGAASAGPASSAAAPPAAPLTPPAAPLAPVASAPR